MVPTPDASFLRTDSSGQEASILVLVAGTPLAVNKHASVPHSIILVVTFLS